MESPAARSHLGRLSRPADSEEEDELCREVLRRHSINEAAKTLSRMASTSELSSAQRQRSTSKLQGLRVHLKHDQLVSSSLHKYLTTEASPDSSDTEGNAQEQNGSPFPDMLPPSVCNREAAANNAAMRMTDYEEKCLICESRCYVVESVIMLPLNSSSPADKQCPNESQSDTCAPAIPSLSQFLVCIKNPISQSATSTRRLISHRSSGVENGMWIPGDAVQLCTCVCSPSSGSSLAASECYRSAHDDDSKDSADLESKILALALQALSQALDGSKQRLCNVDVVGRALNNLVVGLKQVIQSKVQEVKRTTYHSIVSHNSTITSTEIQTLLRVNETWEYRYKSLKRKALKKIEALKRSNRASRKYYEKAPDTDETHLRLKRATFTRASQTENPDQETQCLLEKSLSSHELWTCEENLPETKFANTSVTGILEALSVFESGPGADVGSDQLMLGRGCDGRLNSNSDLQLLRSLFPDTSQDRAQQEVRTDDGGENLVSHMFDICSLLQTPGQPSTNPNNSLSGPWTCDQSRNDTCDFTPISDRWFTSEVPAAELHVTSASGYRSVNNSDLNSSPIARFSLFDDVISSPLPRMRVELEQVFPQISSPVSSLNPSTYELQSLGPPSKTTHDHDHDHDHDDYEFEMDEPSRFSAGDAKDKSDETQSRDTRAPSRPRYPMCLPLPTPPSATGQGPSVIQLPPLPPLPAQSQSKPHTYTSVSTEPSTLMPRQISAMVLANTPTLPPLLPSRAPSTDSPAADGVHSESKVTAREENVTATPEHLTGPDLPPVVPGPVPSDAPKLRPRRLRRPAWNSGLGPCKRRRSACSVEPVQAHPMEMHPEPSEASKRVLTDTADSIAVDSSVSQTIGSDWSDDSDDERKCPPPRLPALVKKLLDAARAARLAQLKRCDHPEEKKDLRPRTHDKESASARTHESEQASCYGIETDDQSNPEDNAAKDRESTSECNDSLPTLTTLPPMTTISILDESSKCGLVDDSNYCLCQDSPFLTSSTASSRPSNDDTNDESVAKSTSTISHTALTLGSLPEVPPELMSKRRTLLALHVAIMERQRSRTAIVASLGKLRERIEEEIPGAAANGSFWQSEGTREHLRTMSGRVAEVKTQTGMSEQSSPNVTVTSDGMETLAGPEVVEGNAEMKSIEEAPSLTESVAGFEVIQEELAVLDMQGQQQNGYSSAQSDGKGFLSRYIPFFK